MSAMRKISTNAFEDIKNIALGNDQEMTSISSTVFIASDKPLDVAGEDRVRTSRMHLPLNQ